MGEGSGTADEQWLDGTVTKGSLPSYTVEPTGGSRPHRQGARVGERCAACKGDGWVPIAKDEVGQPVPCPACCPDDYSRGVADERARISKLLVEDCTSRSGLATIAAERHDYLTAGVEEECARALAAFACKHGLSETDIKRMREGGGDG